MSIQDKAQADLVEPDHKGDSVELPALASDAELPLVSVIIRSMGRETLREALESVASQTYPRIEIVVVNAIGEGHPELPSQYGGFSLHLIQSDTPLLRSRAANVGLDHSTGEYLIFLDDDDLYFPEHIASLVTALRHSIHARCAYAGIHVEYFLGGEVVREWVFNEPFDQLMLWINNFIPIHAALFERSLCSEGCRFDEGFKVYEDWDFWVQLSQHTTFVHVNQISACYRNSGYSGLGLEVDERIMRESIVFFYDKWKRLWTGEQLCQLIQRNKEIATTSQSLKARVEELETLLTEHEAEAKSMASRQQSLKARVEELQDLLVQREAEAKNMASRQQSLKARVEELQDLLAQRDEIVRALRQSTSWRITAPLRVLSLRSRWAARNSRRALLWWLGTGLFRRVMAASVPYYQRHVPLQIKLAIPDAVRHAAKRQLLSDGVGHSQPLMDLLEESAAASTGEYELIEVEEKHFLDLSAEPIKHASVKLIAFYLPQFHAIPENDAWWGEGFTEWTNVRKGRAFFNGHYQPREPAQLGYYNLEDIEVYADQVKLAKKAGIYGFCFHFYWFAGKTLLEKPLRNILATPKIDQPFCFCWANENWTRRWDGQENHILIAQDHSEEDALRFLEHVNTYFHDDRYIKIDGKPLLVVYRPQLIPNITRIQALWRKLAQDLGWPGIYLVSAEVFGQADPVEYEFDAAMEFPPHNAYTLMTIAQEVPLGREFKGHIYDYRDVSRHFRTRSQPNYKLFRSVILGWDNSARRGMHATIFTNFSLSDYAQWLHSACRTCLADSRLADQEKFVFINAWNEWGEGTYLEPDRKYGFGYLEATKRVVNACASKIPRLSVIVPNYNHAHFLERRLYSIIHQSHRPDEIIFLDDTSSDNSMEVARDILRKSNIKFTIIRNETNSGNVFKQWLKGLEYATGDLIWIAESDDAAALDFLENILPLFGREEVLLAYGEISYVDSDDTPLPGLDHYYDGLDDLSWECSHVVSAYRAFTGPFAVKNIIPNVSGAVFRKPRFSENEVERLVSYTFAGDWYFYALVARGGAIAFCKEARSYFRLIRGSTSQNAFFSPKHVREHQMILQDLQELYGIGDAAIHTHVTELWGVLKHRLADLSREELSDALKVKAVEQPSLRICIASYGFYVGGGEVVPIEIANSLRDRGHHVTFLALVRDSEDDSSTLRDRLHRDIPVVYWDDVKSVFRNFLHEFGIEIFNSHNFGVEYWLYSMGIDIDIPYIASLHGGYEEAVEKELLTKGLIKYVEKNVDEWLYLADKNVVPLTVRGLSRARFIKSFNSPVVRPANVGLKLDIRKHPSLGDDALLLVLASRALHSKGWQRAIEVTARLREAVGRDCRLVLIGDGPDFQAIRDANADNEAVCFLGRLDNPFPVIECCDVGIFPSTFTGESFPLFVLECLQSGLPVVATDIGEIPNILTVDGDTAGCVVKRNKCDDELVNEMTHALIELVTDERRMDLARQTAYRAATRYGMDNLVELYLEVMGRC